MENKLLKSEWLAKLENPFDWKIVSTLIESEAPKAKDKSHSRWSLVHFDRHAHREVVLALEGKCVMSLEGELYEITPGTVLLLDSGNRHDKGYPPWTTSCVHLWLSIVKDTVFTRLLKIEGGEIEALNPQNEPLMRISELTLSLPRTWRECADEKFEFPEELRRARIISSLAGVFLEYAKCGFETDNRGRTDTGKRRDEVVDAIKEHIRETAGAGVSLDRLAVISGYSKYHFLRIFKERTGTTVHEFIDQQRMAKYRELTRDGYRKNEIADILGFSSPSTFSRWLHSSDATSKARLEDSM